MADEFFERTTLNSPYEFPVRHGGTDPTGRSDASDLRGAPRHLPAKGPNCTPSFTSADPERGPIRWFLAYATIPR